jgi:hypothetical protein
MAWTWTSALAALAALAIACSSSDTTAPPETDAGPGDTGAVLDDASDAAVADTADAYVCHVTQDVQGPTCSACLDTKCCAETEACLLAAACQALDACLTDCLVTGGGDGGVADCAQGCAVQQPPETQQQWRAYNDCLVRECDVDGAGPCQ